MGYKYPSLRTTPPAAGYYARLDAGAAATDQFTADGSQDGTLTNGATRSGSPLAYLLDGVNDYITFGNVNAWNVINVTVAVWVQVTIGSSIQIANRYYATSADQGWLLGVNADGKATFSGRESGALFISAVGATTLTSGVWTHIAGVKSGTSWKVYVNGVEDGSTVAGNGTTAFATNPLMLGALPVFSLYSALAIDDFVFYTTNLAAAEVAILASQRGAIYALAAAGGGPINSQALIRPASAAQQQLLIQGAMS